MYCFRFKILFFCAVYLYSTFFVFSQIPSSTYTIGGASPTYATFAATVTDLNTNGLVGNGPVTFNVRNGTYKEQISINAITNVSFNDSIIFKSEKSQLYKYAISP